MYTAHTFHIWLKYSALSEQCVLYVLRWIVNLAENLNETKTYLRCIFLQVRTECIINKTLPVHTKGIPPFIHIMYLPRMKFNIAMNQWFAFSYVSHKNKFEIERRRHVACLVLEPSTFVIDRNMNGCLGLKYPFLISTCTYWHGVWQYI